MGNATRNESVEFFEIQFQRQIRQQDYALGAGGDAQGILYCDRGEAESGLLRPVLEQLA